MILQKNLLNNIVLLVVATLFALSSAEYVVSKLFIAPVASAAREHGAEFDTRSRLQVVQDCRKTKDNCYPSIPANSFLETRLEVGDKNIIPLTNPANAEIIGCNEGGYFSHYRTDEYGFRNARGAWSPEDGSIDMAFVGDSYTIGDCVNDGDHFTDYLRQQYPNVLNLGGGGNGPLLQLAAIKEYLYNIELNYVFWVYFERNDLADLRRDKQIPLLLNYLQPDFRQGLQNKNIEINNALVSHIEKKIESKEKGRPRLFPELRLLLWKLRQGQPRTDGEEKNPDKSLEEFDLKLFQTILSAAKDTVESSGGELVFLYLPEFERFDPEMPSPPWSAARLKPQIIDMVSSIGIDHIDVEKTFREIDDPRDFFPFRIQGHYNRQGYFAVGSAIAEYLAMQ